MRTKLRNNVIVPFSEEEENQWDVQEAANEPILQARIIKEAQRDQRISGIDFAGKMLSATKEDQNGLLAVAVSVIFARGVGQTIPPIKFEFQNGTKLTINDSNFDAVYAIWAPFRQSFFE